ncbi:hypothetical protein CPB84DRAFT_1793988 [Gymnopilus junonius]|uniref:AIG1-type G domain-containing protein n=1 Tax=Gymnopilus junonius TaxID=109634 RepID=A0A9P5NEG6_GYMJU|nr:hypothetical protein CPB84DRAFT_1793988 [Gymnopilus junonius]
MPMETSKTVVVFGETGVGKSSVINTCYSVAIKGHTYNLHDTIGLGEDSTGTMGNSKAIVNLYNLLTLLSKNGGVHLLVFVVRSGRLKETMKKNYDLFYKGFCETKIPIVVVVTGCEGESNDMDQWWGRNRQFFEKAGMTFRGHACVCAFKGRLGKHGYVNKDLVEQSRELVKDLIVRHRKADGWKKPPAPWLTQVWYFFLNLFKGGLPWDSIETYLNLLSSGISHVEAFNIMKAMK